MNQFLQKYRFFLILGTAEGIGLILSKPSQFSLFFFAWALICLIALAFGLFPVAKPKSMDEMIEKKPSLSERALQGKNGVYLTFVIINAVTYFVFMFLKL